MKIKVAKKKCFTATDMRTFQRLANYVTSHYPKDSALHKNVRSCFQSFGAAASKLSQAAKPKVMRRKHRRAPAKRPMRRGVKRAKTAPKRRTAMKRKATKRTARRTPRRIAARRSTRRPMQRKRAA
ncbi:MAG: hypothetical protein V3T14_04245 [Myxococcota bacterium]